MAHFNSWVLAMTFVGALSGCVDPNRGSGSDWDDPWGSSYSGGPSYGYGPAYGYGPGYGSGSDNDRSDKARAACRQAAAERGLRVVDIPDTDQRGGGDYRVDLKVVSPTGKTVVRCDYDRQSRYARLDVPSSWGGGSPFDPGQVNFSRARQSCKQAALASGLKKVDVNGVRPSGNGNAQVLLDGKRGGGGGRERLSCTYDGSTGQAGLGR